MFMVLLLSYWFLFIYLFSLPLSSHYFRVLTLTDLLESTVVTSRAASGFPEAADLHTDSNAHPAGPVQPEQGDELSDRMMARHMSIRERWAWKCAKIRFNIYLLHVWPYSRIAEYHLPVSR